MEEFMRIHAEARNEVGKKMARKLRREGKIPAIIYGDRKDTLPITLSLNDVRAILKSEKGENAILKIHRDDIEVDAMLKEAQYDYLSDTVIHADFLRIDLNKSVYVNIPLVAKGVPIGVKLEDGIFDFITREVKIKCLPTNIPREFELDVSGLHAGHSLKASDLAIEEGIQLVSDPHTVICAVTSKSKAEVEVEKAAVEEVVEETGEKPEDKAKPETKEKEDEKK